MNVMPMVDYATKTIILTEAFSRAARVPFSDAFNQLARLREALPGLEVVVREHRRPRVTPRTQNIPKFVSYEKKWRPTFACCPRWAEEGEGR